MALDRPFFALHVSIATHRKTRSLFTDDVATSTYVRLGVYFVREWVGKREGDRMVVPMRDLAWITNAGNAGYAIRRLHSLCGLTPIAYRLVGHGRETGPWIEGEAGSPRSFSHIPALSRRALGDDVEIWFRNFAKKQGFSKTETPPSPSPSPTSEEGVEGRPKVEVSEEARTFAQAFLDGWKARESDFREPSEVAFHKWIVAADRMVRLDERTWSEAEDIATWLLTDNDEGAEFWRANCRSVVTFRRQYEKLRANRSRTKGGKHGRGRPSVEDVVKDDLANLDAKYGSKSSGARRR